MKNLYLFCYKTWYTSREYCNYTLQKGLQATVILRVSDQYILQIEKEFMHNNNLIASKFVIRQDE